MGNDIHSRYRRAWGKMQPVDRLTEIGHELLVARTFDRVVDAVRHGARELTGADGATFVLREGTSCVYVDEDAVAPLWKGRRFPIEGCASGWAMTHAAPLVADDVQSDPRIAPEPYRSTFVRSLAIVPIRRATPIGAIGAYWAAHRRPTDAEVSRLQSLADGASLALENVSLFAELEERLRQKEEAVRVRDEFLSIASHELRTPLTALQLQLEALARSAARDDAATPRLSRAMGSTRKLSALVDRLLDVSRLSLGRVSLVRERLDLAKVVSEVVDRFAEDAARARCVITVDAGVPVEGEWDPMRVEEIASNLLSNAIKYGAGAPVEVCVARDEGGARLDVRDHGIGIRAEDQGRIFERFERAVDVAGYGGCGLGLYIVRQLVEAHGGTIDVESGAGGSRFCVRLP
jgi:signal transduction histidine kinase